MGRGEYSQSCRYCGQTLHSPHILKRKAWRCGNQRKLNKVKQYLASWI